jgi:hypothetical protein
MISISFKSSIRILAITVLFIATAMTMHAQVSLPAAGNISTVAGNGTTGYSGDNGLATSANLSVPEAVAVDAAGNIYIADTFDNVTRGERWDGNARVAAGIESQRAKVVGSIHY